MGVVFTVTSTNARFLTGGMAKAFSGLRSAVETLQGELVGRARRNASGDVQTVHSGRHLAAIKGRVEARGDEISGVVSSDAPGAGALEYGYTIPAREVRPVNKALRFALGGSAYDAFAKVVHLPETDVRPHPVLGYALTEMRPKIVDKIATAVIDGLRG